MSLEAGVVFDFDMNPIYWHVPENREIAYIPDSRALWNFLWENKDNVFGFAHSHPGPWKPRPSSTDLKTFSSIELSLGKRFLWPIISKDDITLLAWRGESKYDYREVFLDQKLHWLTELRDVSYINFRR